MRRLITLTVAAATVASLASVATAAATSTAAQPGAAHGGAGSGLVTARTHTVPASTLAAIRAARASAQGAAQSRQALTEARAQAAKNPHLSPSAAALPAAADGTVRVTVTGDAAAVAAAAKAEGGHALLASHGQSVVRVPKATLAALAASPGVSAVSAPRLPHELAGPSEGVGASGASAWQSAGQTGTGVKIAVVDAGFADIDQEVLAGHLAANQADVNHLTQTPECDTADTEQHGTAVAEIVHQMAPNAELFLYRICTNVGFSTAAQDIINYNIANPTAPITIATSSLGFTGDSRGDGSSSDPNSTVAAVAAARRAGVLWIQSAGNQAIDHWGGKLTDNNGDGLIDLNIQAGSGEDDLIVQGPNSGTAEVDLQWDEWPLSSAHLAVELTPFTCQPDGSQPCSPGTPVTTYQSPNTAPFLPVGLPANTLPSNAIVWDVAVITDGNFKHGARFDLNYFGDLEFAPFSACPTADSGGNCIIPPGAYSQSIMAPAYSPFAVAVGAHDVSDTSSTAPEFYSSQGPTIDGRVKPDISASDGVSSYLPDFAGGFYGTSAAAPHLAGAAALVEQLHPTWDASQVQSFLQRRARGADNVHPNTPPTNDIGAGVLSLGDPATTALPVSGQYHALANPVRVLDTRTTTGGHHAPLNSGQQATVNLTTGPGTLPADATAVAINLAGVNAANTTFLSVFPGGTSWPRTSNLNLTATDRTAAVFAIVSVNALRSIIVRNNLGLIDVVIDEVGYFTSTPVAGGLYSPLATSNRVLDTRPTYGGQGKVPSNGTVTVNPQAPAGATAAIVNITAVNSTTNSGYLTAAPTCNKNTATLNFNTNNRGNLAIVGLSGGTFCISNNVGAVDVTVDVLGFMGTSGAAYVGLAAPQRIMDTRTGNGPVPVTPIPSHQSDVIVAGGTGQVPHTASAVFTGVAEATATATGFLQAFGGATRPDVAAASLNFSAGRIVPNAAVIGLADGGQFGIYNNIGSTNVVVDLFGYFLPTG